MKLLYILMLGLLVFTFTGLQNVGADQADEDYKTGLKYYKGEGVTLNHQEALKWFLKAANQGNANAQCTIGDIYYGSLGNPYYDNKHGVAKDYNEALKWYRRAADQGHAKAQCGVGDLYLDGLGGVTQDYAEALKWYRKAADQGYNDLSYFTIANIYERGGHGVTQDYNEAIKWYRKAADQGDLISLQCIRDLQSKMSPKAETKNPSIRYICHDKKFGCINKEDYSKLIGYISDDDRQAFLTALTAAILRGDATIFKKSEEVYLVDVAMFSGMVKIRRKGETKEYWTDSRNVADKDF